MIIPYQLHSGKNVKALYFAKNILASWIPHIFRKPWEYYYEEALKRSDYDYIMRRVNYYCKKVQPLGDNTRTVSELHRRDAASVYYYDIIEAMRPFPLSAGINYLPGDVTHVPPVPSLTKSRPIGGSNANSVLLKLNKIRHYIWVNDPKRYEEKSDIAIFRGKVRNKIKREVFFNKWFDAPGIDIGDTSTHPVNPQWRKNKMTISDQLKHKFIFSIEGNEVASNLKWIMSSNSVAVMPRPEYETWFMEGTLQPGVHYIEISSDYSDLPQVLEYYIQHPQEAIQIIAKANDYCRQFKDERRETIISTLVIAKYLGVLPV